jgi:hypothetical protein
MIEDIIITVDFLNKLFFNNFVLILSVIGIVAVVTVILFWIDYTFGFGSRGREKNKVKKFLHDYIGLMFKSKPTNPIVFEFDKPVTKPIHSWFVFFPFKAIWYNDDKVIETKIFKPFEGSYAPKKPFNKLVEVAL